MGKLRPVVSLLTCMPSPPHMRPCHLANLSNDATVVVRVNDRGPFVKGRINDVSYHAARVLDFTKKGVQRVRLDFEEGSIGQMPESSSKRTPSGAATR
jgi:peptidoglycan lytic transglycosylase